MLIPVASVEEVIENIRSYQTDYLRSTKARPTAVRHWYYLPDEDIAGPSRFIGYKNMTAGRYDASPVDGRETEPALKRLGKFRELKSNELSYNKARNAAERLLTKGQRLRWHEVPYSSVSRYVRDT